MQGFKVITCRGTPREMGRQYGEAARDEIAKVYSVAQIDDQDDRVKAEHEEISAMLQHLAPDILEELSGIAEGSTQSLCQVILNNYVRRETTLPPQQCTSMILKDGPEGIVLAKNNDGCSRHDIELDKMPFVIRKSYPQDGIPMLQVTYAGWLSGLDAMNAEGLCNSHNSVGSIFDKSGEKIDVRLWVYHLMRRSRSKTEFIEGLNSVSLTGKGFNIAVVDAAGGNAIVEAAVPEVRVRKDDEKYYFATNHFASKEMFEADRRTPLDKEISVYRYGYLRWRQQENPPANAQDIKSILASVEPWAPCRKSPTHHSYTLWSMLALPRERCMEFCPGPPDEFSYEKISL